MGCITYRLPIGVIFNAIGPYLGGLLILVGLIMTFAGVKFIFIVLALNIGLISAGILFIIPYNLFINPESSSAKGWTIALLVIASILAIVIVVLTYKFTKALAVPIMAGIAGAFGFYLIYKVSGLGNKVSSSTGALWI